MSKPTQHTTPQPSRRALLGWFISISGAATFLTFVAAAEGVLSNLPGLFSRRARRGPGTGHDRAKRARIRREVAAAHASSNTELVLIDRRNPSGGVRTSVVHWPHPLLFGRRLVLREKPQILLGNQWQHVVQPHCSVDLTSSNSSTTHFYAAHEGAIRENLALAALSVDKNGGLKGLDEALAILGPLFDDDRQRCNWRLYHLFGRLTCCAESEPARAYSSVLERAWKRPQHETRPKELEFLASAEKFNEWYAKTKTEQFTRRLRKRILFAQALRRGQSSSGQDTVFAERVRSNRPRPLTTQEQMSTRRFKLARRKERRAARKKFSFWDRVKVITNSFRREFGLDSNDQSTTGEQYGTRPSGTKRRKQDRRKHTTKCAVSKRNLHCIPMRRRSPLRRTTLR
jgi:hypothetical protein